MPRIYSDTSHTNELRIDDHISDSKIVLYYRTPTPAEHAKYTNSLTKRKRNKVVNCTGETRQEFGMDILAGFREGDYLKPGSPDDKFYVEKYKAVKFSSDKASECFDPDWKKWVQKIAPDHIELLAIHAFENAASVDDGIELDDGTGEDRD